jgi:arylsulfatase A-like enzyme
MRSQEGSVNEGETAAPSSVPGDEHPVGIAGRPNPWDRPSSWFLLALWFGLVTGSVEAACGGILYSFNRCMLNLVTPSPWIIPITEAIILSFAGLALYVLVRFRVVRPRIDIITLLFTFLLFFTTLMALGEMRQARLYWWAALLLAGGLAIQAKRFSARYPHAFHRLVLFTTPLIIVTIGVIAGVMLGRDALTRRNIALNLPPAPADAPNVLLIVLDTVRAKSMSLYGYNRPTTPNLERWAKRGVVFDRAVSPAPFTLTSHASMFTGRYPQELSADWSVPLDRTYPTLAEVLYAHGYMTVGFVANTGSAGRQTGLNRGFVNYESHQMHPRSLFESSYLFRITRFFRPMPQELAISAAGVNARFFEFLSHWKGRPFFTFLNYMDCHTPYWTAAPLDRPDEPYTRGIKRQLADWSIDSFVRTGVTGLELAHEAYDACLAGLDRAVGALLTEMEKQGELARTIVIIVGDHGEHFGEHGLVQHADSLYRSLLHVPLVVIDPRRPAGGRRIDTMVTLRDLPATILELIGLPGTKIPGDPFADLITGKSAPGSAPSKPKFAYVSRSPNFPPWHPNSKGPVEAVFLHNMHYIKSEQKEELYDFENDPEEQWNLVESEPGRLLLNQYRRLILPPDGS